MIAAHGNVTDGERANGSLGSPVVPEEGGTVAAARATKKRIRRPTRARASRVSASALSARDGVVARAARPSPAGRAGRGPRSAVALFKLRIHHM